MLFLMADQTLLPRERTSESRRRVAVIWREGTHLMVMSSGCPSWNIPLCLVNCNNKRCNLACAPSFHNRETTGFLCPKHRAPELVH